MKEILFLWRTTEIRYHKTYSNSNFVKEHFLNEGISHFFYLYLPDEKIFLIIRRFLDGNEIRASARIHGVHKDSVTVVFSWEKFRHSWTLLSLFYQKCHVTFNFPSGSDPWGMFQDVTTVEYQKYSTSRLSHAWRASPVRFTSPGDFSVSGNGAEERPAKETRWPTTH